MSNKVKEIVFFITGFIMVIIVSVIAIRLYIPKAEECRELGGTYSIVPPICNISHEQQRINELEERIEELEKENE